MVVQTVERHLMELSEMGIKLIDEPEDQVTDEQQVEAIVDHVRHAVLQAQGLIAERQARAEKGSSSNARLSNGAAGHKRPREVALTSA